MCMYADTRYFFAADKKDLWMEELLYYSLVCHQDTQEIVEEIRWIFLDVFWEKELTKFREWCGS